MTDFNQAVILGNLTRDPEFRYTPNGQAVASFSVATNRRWTTSEGNQQEDTQFHNVVAWGKLAEICNQILYKGRKALIVGRIQTRNWEGQDGVKRYTTEIIADHISALGTPKEGAAPATNPNQQTPSSENNFDKNQSKPADNKKSEKKDNDSGEVDLDDIPF